MTEIARAFKVERGTVYDWVNGNPKFKKVLDDIRESVLDLTESQLFNLIKGVPKFKEDDHGNKVFDGWDQRPSESAIFFKLKTLGKNRGYIERAEIETINDPFAQLLSRVAKLKDEGKDGK